jgi:hypothetical protein
MVPHIIFGLSWGEIAAVVATLGAIYAGIRSLLKQFKASITEPLSDQMKALATSIKDLTQNSLKDHNGFDRRLDKHDVRLGKHDVEIGTLYTTVGLRRKDDRNEEV